LLDDGWLSTIDRIQRLASNVSRIDIVLSIVPHDREYYTEALLQDLAIFLLATSPHLVPNTWPERLGA
jgi:hypothetical protein